MLFVEILYKEMSISGLFDFNDKLQKILFLLYKIVRIKVNYLCQI